MQINFLEQKITFVFEVNQTYYRIIFEKKSAVGPWDMRLMETAGKKAVYQSRLEGNIAPDVDFARQIIQTYISQ